eukprot:s7695_g3.t2
MDWDRLRIWGPKGEVLKEAGELAGRDCKVRCELRQVWLMTGQCGLLVEVTDLMLKDSDNERTHTRSSAVVAGPDGLGWEPQIAGVLVRLCCFGCCPADRCVSSHCPILFAGSRAAGLHTAQLRSAAQDRAVGASAEVSADIRRLLPSHGAAMFKRMFVA